MNDLQILINLIMLPTILLFGWLLIGEVFDSVCKPYLTTHHLWHHHQ